MRRIWGDCRVIVEREPVSLAAAGNLARKASASAPTPLHDGTRAAFQAHEAHE